MEQIFNPNINIGAVRGWCLKYVDDAGNAPNRTATAQIAYQNELNAGRIRTSTIPENVWLVGFLTFKTGQYVNYGHVFFIKRNGNSYEIRDSETNGGARGIYRSINEILAWFGAYQPIYTGWSTHCDGRQYAKEGGGSVETIKSMYWRLLGREADQAGINTYTKAANERGWEFVYNDLKNSTEGQKDWNWRNPDAVRALEKKAADATKTANAANTAKDKAVKDLTASNTALTKAKDDLALTKKERDALKATTQSQEATILALQKQLDEAVGGEDGHEYSWVDQLQAWLRGIFK